MRQEDHCGGSNLVTSNTYDWLQYRDELDERRKCSSGNLGVLDSTFPHDHCEIQYSVFKPSERYNTSLHTFDRKRAKEHFLDVVKDCIEALNLNGSELSRIKTGSSGSYFVYGTDGQTLGVFKPKEEEPYGPLSPKWSKWAHRTFFPCFFGRSCLIPNLGYICESAACLLDQRLKTNLVPYTDTVILESSKFYDKRQTWLFLCTVEPRKQKKLGSFQLFLKDYIGADEFLDKFPLPGMYRDTLPKINKDQSGATSGNCDENVATIASTAPDKFEWTGANLTKFRLELEKLVILDYIMRNTDRGLDNWMIKVEAVNDGSEWDIKLAAIDNGLAFPWKHPDEWRSYPYGWLYLPLQILAQPFSEATRSHFLPILTDVKWWDESYREFTNLFSKDSDFKLRMWKKQWAVLKGQAFNVVETLKDLRQGPLELVRRTRCLVVDETMQVPTFNPIMSAAISESMPLLASSPMALYSTPNGVSERIHHLSGISPAALPSATSCTNSFDQNEEHVPTMKTVIIERLQVVNSTPVFTWY